MLKHIGSQWFVFDRSGTKRLSRGYPSHKKGLKRLREIEFFAHKK